MRRFTIEPYAKICFRFAFMFSAVIRVFMCCWRSHVLVYDALKKRESSFVVFGIYKAVPLVMGSQVTLGAIMMTSSAHIDEVYMPGLSELVIRAFFYITVIYMCLVITCDWIEASGFWVSVWYILENLLSKHNHPITIEWIAIYINLRESTSSP